MEEQKRWYRILSWLYHQKKRLDIGIGQVSYVTGKLPELMAFLWLAEFFGFHPTKVWAVVIIVGGLLGLYLLGAFWKSAGFWDTECRVDAKFNPVQTEILQAARKINSGEK